MQHPGPRGRRRRVQAPCRLRRVLAPRRPLRRRPRHLRDMACVRAPRGCRQPRRLLPRDPGGGRGPGAGLRDHPRTARREEPRSGVRPFRELPRQPRGDGIRRGAGRGRIPRRAGRRRGLRPRRRLRAPALRGRRGRHCECPLLCRAHARRGEREGSRRGMGLRCRGGRAAGEAERDHGGLTMSSTPQQRVSPPRAALFGRGRGAGRPTDPGTLGVRGRRARAMYVAVAPYFLLFAVFSAIPIAFTMFLAFTNWRGIGSWDMVGLTNFEYLLHDPLFWKSLKNTLILWVMATVPCLTLATLVALALNSAVRFSTAFRVAYLVPNITSLVAMGILFSSIFSSNFGIANLLLNSVGLDSVRWLQTEWGIKIAIASLTCWSFVGYNALIILAGLQSIEKQVYEAAQIDGAGPVRTFFSITLPMLRPIILFITIMSTIGSLQSFTESQVMTSSQGGGASSAGGVGNSGLTMVLYFYSVAFQENRYGYGATIAWGVMVVVVIFTIINWFATRERK